MDDRPRSLDGTAPAEEEQALRQWFDEYGPPPPPSGWQFDWERWETRQMTTSLRAPQRGWWAAALLAVVLGGAGYGIHQAQVAAVPPLPFALSARPIPFQITMLTAAGSVVKTDPLGGQTGASLTARSLAPGLSAWSGLHGLSTADATAGYDVGGVQVGLAANGQRQVALVIPRAAGTPKVWTITGARTPLTPTKTTARYAVYVFPGPAGAAQVLVAGHTAQFSWIESGVKIPGVGALLGSAWNLGSSPANGPDGSRSYRAPPPGRGRALGLTPDGVVWASLGHQATTVWLLPAVGPRIPLLRVPFHKQFPGILNVQANDPTHLGVLVHLIDAAGTSPDFWWNIGTGQSHALPSLGAPLIAQSLEANSWASASGGIESVSYATGAFHQLSRTPFLGISVQGTDAFGSTIQHRNTLGTFDWATKQFTPAKVTTLGGVPVTINTPLVFLPGWGFTYALYQPSNRALGHRLFIPSVNGQHSYQELLPSGAQIYVAETFLVKTVPGSQTFWVGTVGAGSRFQWTPLGQGQIAVTRGSAIWTQSGRTWAFP